MATIDDTNETYVNYLRYPRYPMLNSLAGLSLKVLGFLKVRTHTELTEQVAGLATSRRLGWVRFILYLPAVFLMRTQTQPG